MRVFHPRSHKGLRRNFMQGSGSVVTPIAPTGDPFMSIHRSSFKRPLIALVMVAASCIAAIAQQAPTPSRVRGTIEAVDGDMLSVKSRSGEDVKLHMTADIRVVGIIKIALADIKVGSFVGTTTVPG